MLFDLQAGAADSSLAAQIQASVGGLRYLPLKIKVHTPISMGGLEIYPEIYPKYTFCQRVYFWYISRGIFHWYFLFLLPGRTCQNIRSPSCTTNKKLWTFVFPVGSTQEGKTNPTWWRVIPSAHAVRVPKFGCTVPGRSWINFTGMISLL